jgi:hypothetical protein
MSHNVSCSVVHIFLPCILHSEQIVVPPEFPGIVKDFTKEIIRYKYVLLSLLPSCFSISYVSSERLTFDYYCLFPTHSPKNLVEFARDYFLHLSEGPESLASFLADFEARQRPSDENDDM